MDVCALCEKPLKNNEGSTVLTAKGSQGINQISALKQDDIVTTSGQKVHTDCRKKYTDKRAVKVLNEIDTNNNDCLKLRSLSNFDFKHKCLFCGKDAKHSSRKRGHDVFPVRSIDFQSKIKETPCKTKKDVFLKNIDHKINFIALLIESFKQHEIPVKQATSDADCLIVQTAVDSAKTVNTVVIGEDTDLLVLLCYHVDSMKHDVYFQSDLRPKRGKGKRIWDVKKTQQLLGIEVCNVLPFLHALTGCDTTSKIHGIGKASAFKVICTTQDFRDIAFKFINAKTKDDVKMLGEQAIIYLYEGQTSENLNHLRFQKFARKVSCSTSAVEVHSLPPTSSAAGFHSMRVFWQTQTWMGNTDLDPTEWGWEFSENILNPMKMTLPAPDYLLKVIHCSCKSGCDSKRCNCRKHGLECSIGCGNCRGVSCSNVPTLIYPSVEDADSADELY